MYTRQLMCNPHRHSEERSDVRIYNINIMICVLTLLMSALTSGAQDLPEMLAGVAEKAEGRCVTMTYRFSLAGEVSVEDEGFVEAQDNLWHLKGNSLEIYTDSASTWVVDNDSKEVIVEPAWSYADLENFYRSTCETGASLDVTILSEKFSEKKQVSYFTPSFGPEWVVTDLR